MTRVGELSVLEVFKFKVFIIFGKVLVYCILPILYVIYLIKLDADLFTSGCPRAASMGTAPYKLTESHAGPCPSLSRG